MKKVSAFRSKGGKQFVLRSLLVIVSAIAFIMIGLESIYDYVFVIFTSFYAISLLYYNYID